MILANLVMINALLTNDFSVSYVAHVGSKETPRLFAIVSLWSSLEGSILFWGAILGVYVSSFSYLYRDRYREYMGYSLGTILGVCAFFALLLAAPANPFLPVFPVPENGPGPNPLLQNHALMVVHPPTLYLGYVGMTIPFGIAVAALLRGKLTEGWLKPLRHWTMIAWTFLGCGIIMGGWWAYEVLGWGGYWAWDPVENASFLPWLAATGYLHSTVVQERRRILKAWTLSLVLGAFLLTILGTFMTRSGVFNSVHSFTQSSIGPIFLVFLAIVLVISIGLVAGRAHILESEGNIETMVSRESAFLINNLIFVTFTFTVLLGTVFPLITEAVKGVQVSVGEPYFDRMAVPLGLLMVFLMGVGPVLPWGRPDKAALIRNLVLPTGAAIVTLIGSIVGGIDKPLILLTYALCAFAGMVTLREMFGPAVDRMKRRGDSLGLALKHTIAGARRRFGGYVVHLAVVIIVVAIATSNAFKYSAEASLEPNQQLQIGEFTLTYRSTDAQQESHRFSVSAMLDVEHDGEMAGTAAPKLNFYPTQREPIGTPHVMTFGATDLYLSLLSFEKDGSRVAIKAFVIPFAPWIWWSIQIIALGSMVSLWPRRRRARDIEVGAMGAEA
jgi:cytochrome c-type biogenesis protein CcmF